MSSTSLPGTDQTTATQVLAYLDDDLFFMNPDTVAGIDLDVPIVSVDVTGRRLVRREPGRSAHPKAKHDVPAYVSAWQQGRAEAYAPTLGAPRLHPVAADRHWTCRAAPRRRSTCSATAAGTRTWSSSTSTCTTRPGRHGRHGRPVDDPRAPRSTPRRCWLAGARPRASTGGRRRSTAWCGFFHTYRPTLIRTLDPIRHPGARRPPPARQRPDRLLRPHRPHRGRAVHLVRYGPVGGRAPRPAAVHRPSSPTSTAATTTSAGRTTCRRTPPAGRPGCSTSTAATLVRWHCGDPQGCGDYSVGQGSALRSPRAGCAAPTTATRPPDRRWWAPRTAGPPSTGCSVPWVPGTRDGGRRPGAPPRTSAADRWLPR